MNGREGEKGRGREGRGTKEEKEKEGLGKMERKADRE